MDTDDSGSNTFDSKLAYVGLDSDMGKLSVGRQSHPFADNIGGKTSIFNVYGGSSDWNYDFKIVKQFKVFNNTIWHYVR